MKTNNIGNNECVFEEDLGGRSVGGGLLAGWREGRRRRAGRRGRCSACLPGLPRFIFLVLTLIMNLFWD